MDPVSEGTDNTTLQNPKPLEDTALRNLSVDWIRCCVRYGLRKPQTGPHHKFTTKYSVDYYQKHKSTYAGSWKYPPRPYHRCLYLCYHSEAKAIKAHDVPATFTLLSFANRLRKSSFVLGAFAVAVSPAIVTGVCYREVVEREIVVEEDV